MAQKVENYNTLKTCLITTEAFGKIISKSELEFMALTKQAWEHRQ